LCGFAVLACAAIVPAGCGRVAGREVEAPLVPCRSHVDYGAGSHDGHSRPAPFVLVRGPRIAQPEVDVRNRSARLPVTARVGPLARPPPPGTIAALISGGTASGVIRVGGMTRAGASREWPKFKPADDRRGGERVQAGREAYEPERTVPARDPGGRSRCRSAAACERRWRRYAVVNILPPKILLALVAVGACLARCRTTVRPRSGARLCSRT
jgi:hypothetical protein